MMNERKCRRQAKTLTLLFLFYCSLGARLALAPLPHTQTDQAIGRNEMIKKEQSNVKSTNWTKWNDE